MDFYFDGFCQKWIFFKTMDFVKMDFKKMEIVWIPYLLVFYQNWNTAILVGSLPESYDNLVTAPESRKEKYSHQGMCNRS